MKKIITIILLLTSLEVFAFPEDYELLRVDRYGMSWVLPTTTTAGTPLPEIDNVVAYCSNSPNISRDNTTFTLDISGTSTRQLFTAFADGNWYCRLTVIVNALPVPESVYSNEVNFTALGGIAPSLAPPPLEVITE